MLKSAVVIGGAGFLGRHLVEHLLERGYTKCTVYDRIALDTQAYANKVTCHAGDIMDDSVDTLADILSGHDVVFHCASPPYSLDDRALFMRVNVDGTRRVIEACRKAGVKRLVLTSSCSVVYNGQSLRNATEETPLPNSYLDCYTETKMLQEQLVIHAADSELMTCAVRPHGIFGPRDHTVSEMLLKAKQGKMTAILGDGSNLVDFTYVKNVTLGHILAAESLQDESMNGQVYNITNDEPVHFWAFVSAVLSANHYTPPTRNAPYLLVLMVAYILQYMAIAYNFLQDRLALSMGQKPQQQWKPFLTPFKVSLAGTHHYYSCEKAKRMLGYKPIVSLQEGLDLTMRELK